MPEVYNPARVQERPIPPVEAEETIQQIANESETQDVSENEEEIDDENEQSIDIEQILIENAQEDDIKPNIVFDAEDLAVLDGLFDDEQSNSGSDSDEIDPLAVEQIENGSNHSVSTEINVSESMFNSLSVQFESTPINVVDSSAITDPNDDAVSCGNNETFLDASIPTEQLDATNHENQIAPGNIASNDSTFFEETTTADQSMDEAQKNEQARLAQIESNVQELLNHGQKVVVDTEVEYIHMPEQQLKGIGFLHRLKSNDALCGKKPFKENVCIF